MKIKFSSHSKSWCFYRLKYRQKENRKKNTKPNQNQIQPSTVKLIIIKL